MEGVPVDIKLAFYLNGRSLKIKNYVTVSGYNIDDLVQEAQTRWLKPAEVLFILQNYNEDQLTHEPPQKPSSNLLVLLYLIIAREHCTIAYLYVRSTTHCE